MKRLTMIFGIMVLAAVFAVPAYAMGGGMEGGMGGGAGGGGMMNGWGSGLIDWFQKWRNGGDYTLPPVEEKNQMEELDQQHDEDSAYLKYQIRMKERQLDALLTSSDPDIQKVRALSKGIRELRDEADQEQRRYEADANKMNPGYRSENGNGWSSYTPSVGSAGRGMGYAGQMRDYGLSR
jgi:Spy/CpxP family protein refolding chaperone